VENAGAAGGSSPRSGGGRRLPQPRPLPALSSSRAGAPTSWAVGGAPHMSPTPIWLVGIVARRPSGRRRRRPCTPPSRGGAQQLNSLFYRSRGFDSAGRSSHFRRVLAASSGGGGGRGRVMCCDAPASPPAGCAVCLCAGL
jgi:hypothetical protein